MAASRGCPVSASGARPSIGRTAALASKMRPAGFCMITASAVLASIAPSALRSHLQRVLLGGRADRPEGDAFAFEVAHRLHTRRVGRDEVHGLGIYGEDSRHGL